MYRLRELRLREMVQNDEESLGALATTEVEEEKVSLDVEQKAASSSSRRSSTIEVSHSCGVNAVIKLCQSHETVPIVG